MDSVCLIGLQLIERIENMHNIGYIHLDLKPDNVLIGSGDLQNHRSRMVYLIDFGISRKYREPDGTHVPFRVDVPFTGNLVFSSVNSFLSYELSRRDDLESLLYLLTYLGIGNLPWICLMSAKSQSVSSHLIKQQKIKIRGEELCKDMPRAFGTLFNYVRGLTFDAKPDYTYLKRGLKSVLDQAYPSPSPQNRPILDWFKPPKPAIQAGPQFLTPKALAMNNLEICKNQGDNNPICQKGPPLMSRISRSLGQDNMIDDHQVKSIQSKSGEVHRQVVGAYKHEKSGKIASNKMMLGIPNQDIMRSHGSKTPPISPSGVASKKIQSSRRGSMHKKKKGFKKRAINGSKMDEQIASVMNDEESEYAPNIKVPQSPKPDAHKFQNSNLIKIIAKNERDHQASMVETPAIGAELLAAKFNKSSFVNKANDEISQVHQEVISQKVPYSLNPNQALTKKKQEQIDLRQNRINMTFQNPPQQQQAQQTSFQKLHGVGGGGTLAFGHFQNRGRMNNIMVSVRNATIYEPSNMPEESNNAPFTSNYLKIGGSGIQNGFPIHSFEVEFDSSEFENMLIDEQYQNKDHEVVWKAPAKSNDLKRINSINISLQNSKINQ